MSNPKLDCSIARELIPHKRRTLSPNLWICFLALVSNVNLAAQLEFAEDPILLESALIFDETSIDVRFKNISKDRSIEIVSIKPSCGCTVVSHSEQPILPNRELSIPARIKARRTEGRQKVTLVATWKYEDTETEHITHSVIERDVLDPVKLSQAKVDFGNFKAESALRGISQQVIIDFDPSLVELTSINPSKALNDVFELQTHRQSEKQIVLNIWIRKQDRLVGAFNGAVILRGRILKSGKEVVWSVPVFATLESDVHFQPGFILIPKMNGDEPFHEDFIVRGPSGLTVEKVAASDPTMTVHADTKKVAADSMIVSVRAGGAGARVSTSGHIDFHVALKSPARNFVYRVQYAQIGSTEPPVAAPSDEREGSP